MREAGRGLAPQQLGAIGVEAAARRRRAWLSRSMTLSSHARYGCCLRQRIDQLVVMIESALVRIDGDHLARADAAALE